MLTMCQNFDNDALPITTNNFNQGAAEALLNEAKALMAKGDYSDARGKLRRLVRLYRISAVAPEARLLYATCYERENDPREAFKQYDKLVLDYPSSSLYLEAINRQKQLAHGAAQGKIATKVFGIWDAQMDPSVVIEWLQSVIKNAPYSESAAESSLILGNYYLKRKMPVEAAYAFRQLVDKYPSSSYAPDAQLSVANLWATSASRGDRNLVNLNKALEAYEEFVLLYPRHAKASHAKAQAAQVQRLMVDEQLKTALFYMERSKEYQSAVFTLEDVIRQESINPTAAAEARKLLPTARALLAGS